MGDPSPLKRKGQTKPGRAAGAAKNLFESKAEQFHRANDARSLRLGFLPNVGEEGVPTPKKLAGRDSPMVFRPPSPVELPPAPPLRTSGPPVQKLSRKAIAALPEDLQACLLQAGQPDHRAVTSGEDKDEDKDIYLISLPPSLAWLRSISLSSINSKTTTTFHTS